MINDNTISTTELAIHARSLQLMLSEMFVKLTSLMKDGTESDGLHENLSNMISTSVVLFKNIDETDIEKEIKVYREVHEISKQRNSTKLRNSTSKLLGTLSIHPNMKDSEINNPESDPMDMFTSAVYPRLQNEDSYFKEIERSLSDRSECLNRKLLTQLDWMRLSDESQSDVKSLLDCQDWGSELIGDFENQTTLTSKRTFNNSHRVVLAEELYSETSRSYITIFFEKFPTTECVLDASGFIDSCGSLTLSGELIPTTIKRLSFINCERCTSIDEGFLYECEQLKFISFTGFSNVTSIGSGFLYCCTSLTNIDISTFSKVVVIESNFLAICKKLSTVDLSVFKNLRDVDFGFLHGCRSVVKIDLSNFNNVTSIGVNFLAKCVLLDALDISGLQSVKYFDENAFSDCTLLKRNNIIGLEHCCSVAKNVIENEFTE